MTHSPNPPIKKEPAKEEMYAFYGGIIFGSIFTGGLALGLFLTFFA